MQLPAGAPQRRWGVMCPVARRRSPQLEVPTTRRTTKEFLAGSGGKQGLHDHGLRAVAQQAVQRQKIGKYIVPIVPDESRTFGMEGMFRQVGIYAHAGQLYEPVDSDQLMYYKEAKDGQILEEGITEARFDGLVHRGRHRLLPARHQHDPVLHLLLDVRLPADWRL